VVYLIFTVGFGLAYLFGYRAGRLNVVQAIAAYTVKHGVDAFAESLKAAIAARKVGKS
jgi:hypothetical protein